MLGVRLMSAQKHCEQAAQESGGRPFCRVQAEEATGKALGIALNPQSHVVVYSRKQNRCMLSRCTLRLPAGDHSYEGRNCS
jgi:hypothetical protein